MICDMYEYDTIAAVATAPGKGGISVVRISGPQSLAKAKMLFRGTKDPQKHNRMMIYGHIVDSGEILDEVLLCFMKSPHSYTREDMVEIHCHGGYAAASAVIAALTRKGIRLAEPGEFTKRAFLNGRIDLVQAESVMEIVMSESSEHLKRAEKLMDGTFSGHIDNILEKIAHCLTYLELNIDFLNQDNQAIQWEELRSSISSAIDTIDTMIVSYTTAKRIRDGLQVVIAGKVNSGKSSLFNTLLGRKRAIVNGSPGTTRDWLEERIELEGISINLIDTAGLRQTDNDVEQEGVRESMRLISDADIIISLVESIDKDPVAVETFENDEYVIRVLSKSDLLSEKKPNKHWLPVSVKTGAGLKELKKTLVDKSRLLVQNSGNNPVVLIDRHRNELQKARDALKEALKSMESWSEEITALELREAKKHIEAILGRTIDIDVLDSIFRNFCIGK